MKPTIKQIENAFQPSREINDAERFAGRRTEVQDIYLALLTDGANIAIVGNRGIGKSSLARQVINIAEGDNEILERLGIEYDGKLDFLTCYLACSTEVLDINDLLLRLLTTRSCLADWIYDIPTARQVVSELSPEISAQVLGIGARLGGQKSEEEASAPAVKAHPLDVVFTNVCHAIVSERIARNGLLIVIDEFDQIRDPKGAAGLLKSMATNVPQVKFCLVGVAQDIQNLMREHESTDRLFAGSIVRLPPMRDSELVEILRIAEKSIDYWITFDRSAEERLCRLAQGHPYMVHLIGKYALRTAFQSDKRTIDEEYIQLTLRSIAERGADPVLEGRYKKAVGSSAQREIVLKAMAEVRSADGESWTTDAYKLALDRGVENASQYVGQLVTDEYGGELIKIRERYYRFKDSLFAAYVCARPYLFGQEG